ncbi:ArfGap-domain-containing protein, partial [Rhizodiscina lignyota]
MAGTLNKRQQARNERALQDLIKNVPGNDKCADCGARNPGWASWSLGVFLCLRCAALHRKVGTHVTKVKSLSMDSWSNDQVDNMKKTGNAAANRIYNPRNIRPSIPIDVDEVDGAMERFIRQKYEQRTFSDGAAPAPRQHTGSTSTSSEGPPPPLPPKPSKRFHFGLRSSSSSFPMPRPERITPPVSPGLGGFGRDTSPPRLNKASRVFGSAIGNSSSESFDSKLAQLREMGFPDERRNSTVLKGLNGNIDRAVEALIRLGEGSKSPTRTGSPAVPPKDDPPAGISIQKTRQPPMPAQPPLTETPAAITSTNPFDALNQQQTVQAPVNQQTRSFTTPNPYNPFMPAQP